MPRRGGCVAVWARHTASLPSPPRADATAHCKLSRAFSLLHRGAFVGRFRSSPLFDITAACTAVCMVQGYYKVGTPQLSNNVVENRRDTARADTKSKKSQKSKSQKTRDTVYCIDYSQLLGQLYNTNPDPDPVTVGGKRVSTQALALWLVDALLHSLSTHSLIRRWPVRGVRREAHASGCARAAAKAPPHSRWCDRPPPARRHRQWCVPCPSARARAWR